MEVIPWSFCAWGLQPVDGGRNEFHRKRTWGLAVRVPGLRDVLARACPGTSITHVHVACKGNRPGAKFSRCTEAGRYPQDFCRGLAEALQQRLRVHHPAGGEDSADEHCQDDPHGDDEENNGATEEAAQLEEDSTDEHCQDDPHGDDEENNGATEEAARLAVNNPKAEERPTHGGFTPGGRIIVNGASRRSSGVVAPTKHTQYRVAPAETGFISRLRGQDDGPPQPLTRSGGGPLADGTVKGHEMELCQCGCTSCDDGEDREGGAPPPCLLPQTEGGEDCI